MPDLTMGIQPPRDRWQIEIVYQDEKPDADGIVSFEYNVRDGPGGEIFLRNNHRAQIRTDHQRIKRDVDGNMLHVSGAKIAPSDVFEFMENDSRAYKWVDKDGDGNWRDDKGRTLAPYMFAAAPWVGGDPGELDPQWERERYTAPLQDQIDKSIQRYLGRAERNNWIGDKRGTTLQLTIAHNLDDGFIRGGDEAWLNSSASASVGSNGLPATQFTLFNSPLRFINVTIPGGVTITSAVLTFTATSDQSGTDIRSNLAFDEDADSARISSYVNWDARVRTTVTAWDDIGAWTQETEYESPNFAAGLQPVIDLGGWASGQALHALWDEDGGPVASNKFRSAYSHDNDSLKAAQLDIDYTAAGSVTGAAVLSGAGAASAVASSAVHADASLTGAGALSVVSIVDALATATLSGSGDLSAVGGLGHLGVATLSGAGALSASATVSGVASRRAVVTWAAFEVPTATAVVTGAAALSGSGDLSAAATVDVLADATLSGTGSLTAAASVASSGAAVLSGDGSMTGAGLVSVLADCTLSGVGDLATIATVSTDGACALTGNGSLSASGLCEIPGAVAMSGSGALVAVYELTVVGAAVLSGDGALSSSASVGVLADASLSGAGALTVVGLIDVPGAAVLTGSGVLTATAFDDPRIGIIAGTASHTPMVSGTASTADSISAGGGSEIPVVASPASNETTEAEGTASHTPVIASGGKAG